MATKDARTAYSSHVVAPPDALHGNPTSRTPTASHRLQVTLAERRSPTSGRSGIAHRRGTHPPPRYPPTERREGWQTVRTARDLSVTGDTISTQQTPRLKRASAVTNSHREIHVDTVTNTAPTTGDAPKHADESATTVQHGLRVDVDGTFDAADLEQDQNDRCGAAIRKHLGCRLFDVVAVTDEIDMWIDDEGIGDFGDVDEVNAALNPLATLLVADHRPIYQPYFGAVLFTSREGERTVGLNDEQLRTLRDKAERLAAKPRLLDALPHRVIAAVTAATRMR
jgi:hypothetical protein